MNTQNTNLLKPISKEETKNLATVINETIAFSANNVKSFTAADLWNIQRSMKSSFQRRHCA
jgi:hypothetical protein